MTDNYLLYSFFLLLLAAIFIVFFAVHKTVKKKVSILYIFFIVLFVSLSVLCISIHIYNAFFRNEVISTIKIDNYDNINNAFDLNVETNKKNIKYCALSNNKNNYKDDLIILAGNNKCSFKNINENYKYLYLIYKNDKEDRILISDYINKILEIEIDKNEVYMLENENVKVNYNIITFGEPKLNISFHSNDENIASIEDLVISGKKVGSAEIILENDGVEKAKINVVVTDLITSPVINYSKPFLSCGIYNEEEAKLVDSILFYKVRNAGEATRAGVVEAIRFLILEFKYKIPYFLENGRLTKLDRYADGEGRFYHKGLYLNENKFSEILASREGPQTWGCSLYEYDSELYRPNGLDCSGFVSWAIYNGGFDIGDFGAAGWSKEEYPDLIDFGEEQYITMEFLESERLKAGDIASIPGHVALVAGIDRENRTVYIAEELRYSQGATIIKLTYDELVTHNNFTHFYLMDGYYKNDGNYTDMW